VSLRICGEGDDVNEQPVKGTPSAEIDIWVWIVTGGLLVLGLIVGVGALALMDLNQQQQLPTGSQSVPSSK
jgi:hypothetical protein